MTVPHEHDVRQALQGIEFPADQEALLGYAITRLAKPTTLEALETVPCGQYENVQHVLDAVPGDMPRQ